MQTTTKKQLHHLWTRFRAVRPLHLVLAVVIMSGVSALALRANNQRMLELRQAVFVADERGGDVEATLRELRQHVYTHMNTNLASGSNAVYPPIQLKYTYERLLAEAQADAKAQNAQVYTEAQAYCEQQYPDSFSGGPRVPCIRDYVASHNVATPTIPDSLYKFDFVSPRWSPDLAGWSIVVTGLLIVALLVRLLVPVILRQLKVL